MDGDGLPPTAPVVGKLTCGHKKGRCHTCDKCARCECRCQEDPAVRLARKRGGQAGPRTATAARLLAPLQPDPHSVYVDPDSDGDIGMTDDTPNDPDARGAWKQQVKAVADVLGVEVPQYDLRRLRRTLDYQACCDSDQLREWQRLKRVARQLVQGICELLCPSDAVLLLQQCAQATAASTTDVDDSLDDARLLSDRLATAIVQLPRKSVQRDTVLAVASILTEKTLREKCQRAAQEAGKPDAQLFTSSKLALARQQWKLISAGHNVPELSRQQARGRDDDIEQAVRFIFQPDHIMRTAWGERKLVTGDVIPAIVRMKTPEAMWAAYSAIAPQSSVRRSSFLSLVGALTARNAAARGAIDVYYAEYGLATYQRLQALVKDMQSTLPPACQGMLQVARDGVEEVFRFLHDNYRSHVRSSSFHPDAPQRMVYKDRHKSKRPWSSFPEFVAPATSQVAIQAAAGAAVAAPPPAAVVPAAAPARRQRGAARADDSDDGDMDDDEDSIMDDSDHSDEDAQDAATVDTGVAAATGSANDPLHDRNYALDKGAAAAPDRCSSCGTVWKLFSWLHKCAGLCPDADKRALWVRGIDRWKVNYRCWMAHTLRAVHQQEAIDAAASQLTVNRALLIVDFKVCVASPSLDADLLAADEVQSHPIP